MKAKTDIEKSHIIIHKINKCLELIDRCNKDTWASSDHSCFIPHQLQCVAPVLDNTLIQSQFIVTNQWPSYDEGDG